MYHEENNISALPTGFDGNKGPELLVDQDSPSYLHPDGNQSTLTFELVYPSEVTAVSSSPVTMKTTGHEILLFSHRGFGNNVHSVISENEIPPFSDPSEQQLVAFENDKNFSTTGSPSLTIKAISMSPRPRNRRD